VNAPPRSGPTTDAIPNILDKLAMYMGRLARGTEYPIMVIPPENNADAPAPATARPTMSIAELVAAAHITEPTGELGSKISLGGSWDITGAGGQTLEDDQSSEICPFDVEI
jgi:hypothetical protein